MKPKISEKYTKGQEVMVEVFGIPLDGIGSLVGWFTCVGDAVGTTGLNTRILLLALSAMYTFPLMSTVASQGTAN